MTVLNFLSFRKHIWAARKLCRFCRSILKSKWLPYVGIVLGVTAAFNIIIFSRLRLQMQAKRPLVYHTTTEDHHLIKTNKQAKLENSKRHLSRSSLYSVKTSAPKSKLRAITNVVESAALSDNNEINNDAVAKPGIPVQTRRYGEIGVFSNETLKNSVGSGMLIPGSEKEAVFRRLIGVRKVKIINPHDFSCVINPVDACKDQTVDAVLAVVTAVQNFDTRHKFRYSIKGGYAGIWNKANKVVLLFFIGVPKSGNASLTQDKVTNESKRFGDIVQGNYIDSYRNLSLKTVSILKWVSSYCNTSKYMIKTDDDCDVNIPLMLTELNNMRALRPLFMLGKISRKRTPLRNKKSKWFIPYSMYSKDNYPIFLYGGSQGYPTSVAKLLYEAAIRVPPFWLEDVYISGLCAAMLNIPRYDSKAFYFTHFPSPNETEY